MILRKTAAILRGTSRRLISQTHPSKTSSPRKTHDVLFPKDDSADKLSDPLSQGDVIRSVHDYYAGLKVVTSSNAKPPPLVSPSPRRIIPYVEPMSTVAGSAALHGDSTSSGVPAGTEPVTNNSALECSVLQSLLRFLDHQIPSFSKVPLGEAVTSVSSVDRVDLPPILQSAVLLVRCLYQQKNDGLAPLSSGVKFSCPYMTIAVAFRQLFRTMAAMNIYRESRRDSFRDTSRGAPADVANGYLWVRAELRRFVQHCVDTGSWGLRLRSGPGAIDSAATVLMAHSPEVISLLSLLVDCEVYFAVAQPRKFQASREDPRRVLYALLSAVSEFPLLCVAVSPVVPTLVRLLALPKRGRRFRAEGELVLSVLGEHVLEQCSLQQLHSCMDAALQSVKCSSNATARNSWDSFRARITACVARRSLTIRLAGICVDPGSLTTASLPVAITESRDVVCLLSILAANGHSHAKALPRLPHLSALHLVASVFFRASYLFPPALATRFLLLSAYHATSVKELTLPGLALLADGVVYGDHATVSLCYLERLASLFGTWKPFLPFLTVTVASNVMSSIAEDLDAPSVALSSACSYEALALRSYAEVYLTASPAVMSLQSIDPVVSFVEVQLKCAGAYLKKSRLAREESLVADVDAAMLSERLQRILEYVQLIAECILKLADVYHARLAPLVHCVHDTFLCLPKVSAKCLWSVVQVCLVRFDARSDALLKAIALFIDDPETAVSTQLRSQIIDIVGANAQPPPAGTVWNDRVIPPSDTL